jgi:large-conductance mechanosensitive channel
VVNKLIVVLIALVIGLALTPVVGGFVGNLTQPLITLTATTTAGYTGTTLAPSVVQSAGMYNETTVGSLLEILPVLFVIILIAGTVGFIVLSKKHE